MQCSCIGYYTLAYLNSPKSYYRFTGNGLELFKYLSNNA